MKYRRGEIDGIDVSNGEMRDFFLVVKQIKGECDDAGVNMTRV